MDAVQCTATSPRLVDCPFNNDTSFDTHAKDAGVQCVSYPGGELPVSKVLYRQELGFYSTVIFNILCKDFSFC